MNLESLLKALNFTGLTLYAISNGRWQASVRMHDRDSWRVHIANTPEEALRLALTPSTAKKGGVFE